MLSRKTLELCLQPLRPRVGNSLSPMGKLIRHQLGKQRMWMGYPLCGLLEAPYWWLLKPTAVSKIGWMAKAL